MRKLSLSLIAVVVVSIISLGWVLNRIYIQTRGDDPGRSAYAAYLDFSDDLYSSLANSPLRVEFIQNWNRHSHIQLALLPREDFPLPDTLAASFDQGERLILESGEGVGAHYALDDGLEVLAITWPSHAFTESDGKLELILTLSFYGGVTVIILLWVWPLIHRLLRLSDAARKFGKGELSARVNVVGVSYIREIEVEFNRMADRIESLLNDNKLLTRAVSHDLKTPLARLRFGLDALTDTSDATQRARYAIRVNRDMEEMESLINTLLQYARLDENRIQIQREEFDVAPLVQSLIESYERDDVAFLFDCSNAPLTIHSDQRYFSMLINNLLSNASRYASSRVRVGLRRQGTRLHIEIEDDGAGIASEELEHVTKPFWRGQQGAKRKGHGMGLAIVSRIAEWLGADLQILRSKSLGGAAVHLIIPM
ncbi:ATP-binding protein [Teredinibacter turnerae]|uniref:ATP-binding protein n=1 Tax=Teredinibacter turnerae TaxID=2426 RepID=UPI0030CEFF40